MSTSKLRGKSAIHINDSVISTNPNNSHNTLLKIESVVPKLTTRVANTSNLNHSSRLKTFHRSHSTLSTSYLKKVSEKRIFVPREAVGGRESPRDQQPPPNQSEPQPDGSVLIQNGITSIKRSEKDRDKHPDRVNLDRKGLSSIPIIDDEPNLRLLSLQHNLINTFHIPAETDSNNNEPKAPSTTPPSMQNSPKTTPTNTNTSNNIIGKDSANSSPTNCNPTNATNSNSPYVTNRNPKQLLRQKSTSRSQLYLNNNNINYLAGKVTLSAKPLNGQTPTCATSPTNAFLQKPSSILLNAQHRNLLKKSNSFISNATLFPSPPAHQQQPTSVLKLKNKLLLTPSFSIDNLNNANETTAVHESNTSNGNSNNNSGKTTPTNPPPPSNGTNHFVNPQAHISPILSAAEPRYNLQNLVFLDLYDNQIEKISCLDGLKCLTVLLLGKNRITDISGLISLRQTLRVLDLHGNKIANIASRINQLQELKSLNLAGNQLRQIHTNDFNGLVNLKELNLKRNRIKKIHGFDDLRSLERLWLCHNDLQCVEDMSAIAKAINLKEVTIENNPVSLAGDCVSFLVSYLPGLVSLSQMQITEQVRRAASAWRKNKELSDMNYSNLTTDVCQSIRREEIISNARTNWELLRSQQSTACRNVQRTAAVPKEVEMDLNSNLSDINRAAKPKKPSGNTNGTTVVSNTRGSRAPVKKPPPSKKLVRSSSQDNSGSQLSEQGGEDYFRLPPILAPFLEQSPPTIASTSKIESSDSSTGLHADSSISSALSSDNEELNVNEIDKDLTKDSQVNEIVPIAVKTPESESPPLKNPVLEQPSKPPENGNSHSDSGRGTSDTSSTVNQPDELNNDKMSTLSTVSVKTTSDSIITTSSTSENDSNRATISQKPKPAAPVKRYGIGTLIRTNTARSNTVINNANSLANSSNLASSTAANSNSSNIGGSSISGNASTNSNYVPPSKPKVADREREQGGDYLIEICGRYLNVYGMGALKYIDKQWNMTKASDVHTVKFSYINFNSITAILCRIKIRFVNAENFIFRETNIICLGQINALAESQGVASLTIDPEGNPITCKPWRNYAIYRLSHWGLKQINGIEITEEEVQDAEIMYAGLSDLVLWSLPEGLLQPLLQRLRLEETAHATKMTAKEWLMQADSSLKNIVGKEALQWKKHSTSQDDAVMRTKGKAYFARMLDNTCNAVDKLQQLENTWPTLLLELIRNTLIDYSQIDVYVRNMMLELLK